MRYLSMIRIREDTGQVPSERLMREMGQLMEELTRTGQLAVALFSHGSSSKCPTMLQLLDVTSTSVPFCGR